MGNLSGFDTCWWMRCAESWGWCAGEWLEKFGKESNEEKVALLLRNGVEEVNKIMLKEGWVSVSCIRWEK